MNIKHMHTLPNARAWPNLFAPDFGPATRTHPTSTWLTPSQEARRRHPRARSRRRRRAPAGQERDHALEVGAPVLGEEGGEDVRAEVVEHDDGQAEHAPEDLELRGGRAAAERLLAGGLPDLEVGRAEDLRAVPHLPQCIGAPWRAGLPIAAEDGVGGLQHHLLPGGPVRGKQLAGEVREQGGPILRKLRSRDLLRRKSLGVWSGNHTEPRYRGWAQNAARLPPPTAPGCG